MKSEKIKLSVIVPVCNVVDYLEDCVLSVMNQTYDDWELLLIDDGSSDGSSELCDKFEKMDNRIRVFHKEYGGVSSARNAGVDNAKGEYISFVDSDDYINSGFISIMMKLVTNNNSDIVMCDYKRVAEDAHHNNDKALFDDNKILIYSGKESIKETYKSEKHGMNWLSWSKVIKKDLFTRNDIRFPEGMINEDVAIIYKLFYYAERVLFYDSILYYYRNRSNSIMNSQFSKIRLDVIGKTRETCDFFLHNNEEELAAFAFNYHIRSAYTLLYKYMNCQESESEKNRITVSLKKQLRQDVIKYTDNKYYPKTKEIVYRFVSLFPYKFILKQIRFK